MIGRCGGAPWTGIEAFETRFFAVSHCRSLRGHTFCVNRKYAKNHKRGGDCDFPAPFETPPLNRQRGTVRGSPLIPSKGWQSFSKPASFLYQVYFLQKSLSAMLSIAPTSGGSRRGIAIPLLSLRVRVHRERGSRNTLSLCVSLVTFSTSRKSPHGVTGSSILQKVISESAASLGRTPAPAPFIYTYAACIPTA